MGSQAVIRNPALPLEQNVYLYDTYPNFFPYKYAIVHSNEIILEMSVSNREKIYSHAKVLERQVTFQTAIGTQKVC